MYHVVPFCGTLCYTKNMMKKELKNDFVKARIEPELKAEVHGVLDELGITPSQAIYMFYKMIQREHGIPFSLMLPNAETKKAIEEAKKGEGLTVCKDSDELFKDLDI